MQLSRFRDAHAQFAQLGAEVVGMSIDSVYANKAFAEKLHLPFPLVGDPNRTFTRAVDVLLPEVAGIRDVTFRAVMVVDSQGTVRWRWGADTKTQPDPTEAVEQVRQIVQAG